MPKKMTDTEFKKIINEKFNGNIIPLEDFISYRKSTKMKFKCKKLLHDETFTISAQQILRTQGKGCPFCNGQSYTNSMVNDLLFKKFAEKIIIKEKWNNVVDTVDSEKIFICSKHGEFKTTLHLLLDNYKYGCPHCFNKNKGLSKRNKGLENLKKSMKNCNFKLKEETYTGVNNSCTFICSIHGEFKRTPGKIIYEHRYTCPKCSISNGEQILFKIFEELNFNEDIDFIHQYPILNYKCDFYFKKLNIVIEFDGKQHFDKNSKFYSEEQVNRDNAKNEYCINNNIAVIRLLDDCKGFTENKINIIKKEVSRILINKEFSSTTIETIPLFGRRK